MKHNHTFGCPVFALQNALAAGGKLPKWSSRARLELNLGPSPNHAWNVNLVLNLSTSLFSPQYSAPDVVTSAQWRLLAGLKKNDGSRMPSNIEVAVPNCEEPLGNVTLEDPIQFESKVSLEKENENQASHQNPARASEGDNPPRWDASTSS